MSFVILEGKERYQTAEGGKTNIKIPRKSYYDGKHKIIDKSISVVFEEETVHIFLNAELISLVLIGFHPLLVLLTNI
jgi:hypothetical protein